VMAGLWTEVFRSASDLGKRRVHRSPACSDTKAMRSTSSPTRRGMVQAGAQPLTTIAYVSELQRDWARPTADDVAKLFAEHGGGFGQGLRWEWQLLALKEGTR
jgi:hypothetical protein